MNEITKLEVFAAYLPYQVAFLDYWRVNALLKAEHLAHGNIESDMLLKLRPLSELQTPMLHPVTGERIENPLTWITAQIGKPYYNSDIEDIFSGDWECRITIARQIDRLALSLHFDIYGAIEKGWAVQI